MITTKQYEPTIGQLWISPDHCQFKITDLMVEEDDAWVAYSNVQTGQEYTCRLEAFRHIFTPQVN